MALPFYNWSRTAANNATADSTVNWAEGMAPSGVNDSGRAMMASTAAFRDDISGAITTGGTSTAYTVTSYQVFDTLAHLNGQMIAFVPHTTSTNAVGVDVTLNVDGLGAKSVRMQPSVALPTGTLVSGTPYMAVYNNSDGVFYLHNTVNPYVVPLAGGMDFWGSTAPNSSFALPYGQAISRTTYATLFALISTTYGTGDGSTTFNLPDCRGRVIAGKDDMGGSAASRLTSTYYGTSAATLGAVGGGQSHALTSGEIPTITATNASQSITVTSAKNLPGTSGAISNLSLSGGAGTFPPGATSQDWTAITSMTGSNSISATYTNSSQTQVALIQPTIIANKLIRII